jgi:hypothetical protein
LSKVTKVRAYRRMSLRYLTLKFKKYLYRLKNQLGLVRATKTNEERIKSKQSTKIFNYAINNNK